MRNALNLLVSVLVGATAGFAVAWLLNLLYAGLVTLCGATVGTCIYVALCAAAGVFGTKYLIEKYFVVKPDAKLQPAFRCFAR